MGLGGGASLSTCHPELRRRAFVSQVGEGPAPLRLLKPTYSRREVCDGCSLEFLENG